MNEFFASIYEKFYPDGTFADDLYQQGVYSSLGVAALFGGLFMMFLFYYLINRPSFSRWYHWLIVLCIHFVLQYAFSILQTKPSLSELSSDYDTEFWTFALSHAVIATIVFIAASFLLRWWSKNCKQTPIPN